jgi:hypothetical protein
MMIAISDAFFSPNRDLILRRELPNVVVKWQRACPSRGIASCQLFRRDEARSARGANFVSSASSVRELSSPDARIPVCPLVA